MPSSSLEIVDTHNHLYPPTFARVHVDQLVAEAGGVKREHFLEWTPRVALEQMDRTGIATAVMSITAPGIWTGDAASSGRAAREANDFGAAMIQDYPLRFGMFAAIPMPNVQGSLREIAYALDTLQLDGVGLVSSYGGKFLGDPEFAPVFDELNRRGCVVFVHPTSTCGNPVPFVGPAILEFPNETTRTIVSLLFSGTFNRCPNIRFIFPHGGGTIPFLVGRIVKTGSALSAERRAELFPDGVEAAFQRQYYDLASVAVSSSAMAAIRDFIPLDHLLYASDMPYVPSKLIADAICNFDLPAAVIDGILRENALKLLERIAKERVK